MQDYLKYLSASDGTGRAVLAHVGAKRNPGSTIIEVDNTDKWPDYFIVTTGAIGAKGFITESSLCEMYAHLTTSGDIEIDGFCPGFVDKGNSQGEVAVIKQTTSFSNGVVDILNVAHEKDGRLKDNSVTTNAINDGAVNNAKIADKSITANKTAFGGDYSHSEVNTGFKWVNGKPIYKRTFSGAINVGANKQFTRTHINSGVEYVLKIEGFYYTSGDGIMRPAGSPYISSNGTLGSHVSAVAIRPAGRLEIQFGNHNASVSGGSYTVSVEYTKA